MNIDRYIEIPADKLRQAISLSYEMSRPQGMGIMHFTPGPLAEEDIDAIIARGSARVAADMDYVRGRACKFHVLRSADAPDSLFISPSWYDHGDCALEQLLTELGIEDAAAKMKAAKAAQEAA